MHECKPLPRARSERRPDTRGLHSSTFRLNVSAFCGIGGAFWDCLGAAYGVLRGIGGYYGVSRVYAAWETAQVGLKSARV